jgi:hypothetical protein
MPSVQDSQAFFPCGSQGSPDPGLCLKMLFQNANTGNLLARMGGGGANLFFLS